MAVRKKTLEEEEDPVKKNNKLGMMYIAIFLFMCIIAFLSLFWFHGIVKKFDPVTNRSSLEEQRENLNTPNTAFHTTKKACSRYIKIANVKIMELETLIKDLRLNNQNLIQKGLKEHKVYKQHIKKLERQTGNNIAASKLSSEAP